MTLSSISGVLLGCVTYIILLCTPLTQLANGFLYNILARLGVVTGQPQQLPMSLLLAGGVLTILVATICIELFTDRSKKIVCLAMMILITLSWSPLLVAYNIIWSPLLLLTSVLWSMYCILIMKRCFPSRDQQKAIYEDDSYIIEGAPLV